MTSPRVIAAELIGATSVELRLIRRGMYEHWSATSGANRWVLRRYGDATTPASAEWEERTVAALASQGWPVPTTLASCIDGDGRRFTLLPFLPGRKRPSASRSAGYDRGRLLARLHGEAPASVQRPQWTSTLHAVMALVGDGAILDALADLARLRRSTLDAVDRMISMTADKLSAAVPSLGAEGLIHGDFHSWNLLYQGGEVSGVLDFEKARVDVAAVDIAFATWGGRYQADVVAGYGSVRPLTAVELDALEPLWRGICLSSLAPSVARKDVSTIQWALDHALRQWGH